MATDIKLSRNNVWFNFTCYHHFPPPPPRPQPGPNLWVSFYRALYSPQPGTHKKRQFPIAALNWSHNALTQKRNNVAFFIQNQDSNIYFCAKHTINIPETLAVHSTSTPRPMIHYNLAFPALYGDIRTPTPLGPCFYTFSSRLRQVQLTLFYK